MSSNVEQIAAGSPQVDQEGGDSGTKGTGSAGFDEGGDSGTKGTGSAGLQPDSRSAERSQDTEDQLEPNHNQTLLRDI